MSTDFSLKTIWHIPAPLEPVWFCLIHTESWPNWWKYIVSVQELDPGTTQGIFNKRSYLWHTCLPYNLQLDMIVTQLVPYQSVTVNVNGDLNGTGDCKISNNGTFTRVEFYWQVQVCKPWMNRIGALARPIFKWNHTQVMKQGESGLIAHLSRLKNPPIT